MKHLLIALSIAGCMSAQDPAGKARITGTITGEGGESLRGEVSAVVLSGQLQMHVSLSDESGAFAIDVPAGRATLIARADGYVSEQRELVISPALRNPPVEFRLSTAGSASGVVIDSSGAPVPGARVWLAYLGESGGWRRAEEAGGEQTDAFGRFTIPVVAKNRPFRLHAESQEWLLSSSGTLLLRGRELSGLMLLLSRRGTVVYGRVLNVAGQPVPGALVELRAVPASSEFSAEQRGTFAFARTTHKSATAGADGAYRLTGVPAGRLILTAETTNARTFMDAVVSAGQEMQIDLTLTIK